MSGVGEGGGGGLAVICGRLDSRWEGGTGHVDRRGMGFAISPYVSSVFFCPKSAECVI